jgi:hypothetical protein
MTAWLHQERTTLTPYGAPDQRSVFTPGRVAIEKLDGSIVAERYAPKDSFAGHQMNTQWDPLHRVKARKRGVCCTLTFPVQSKRIASFKTFSWVRI